MGRLADLFLVGTALWLVLWPAVGDRNGWLAALNAWAFWGLALGLPLGAWRLGARDGRLLLGWSALLSGLLRYRYPFLLRRSRNDSCPPHRVRLRLLSFNLLKRDRSMAAVAALMDREQPHIVLFQEAIPALCARLEERLSSRYPYRFWLPYAPTQMGLAVVSRYPFAVTGIWDEPALEPYGLRIQVHIPGRPTLDLYNVQFISPTNEVMRLGPTRLLEMRRAQARHILQAVTEAARPAVIMGDWNSTEGTGLYEEFARPLQDGWAQVGGGSGWTWPVSANPFADVALPPVLRLDYCFLTPGLQPLAMQVIRRPLASDHAPIVIDLAC